MEKQQELFNDFKDGQGGNKPPSKNILPNKTFTLVFSYDKLIIAAIVSIGILTIVFALGFEKGKGRAAPAPKSYNEPKVPPVSQKPITQTVNEALPRDNSKAYTIQVASFKSKETAQQEALKLTKKGFSTTIVGINSFYVVWVGEFSNANEASKTLAVLKKIYNDCYLRKR